MSKLLKLLLFILVFAVFTSCETDFNPNAEYKDISVVYGILNKYDSISYIKVNKAFLGEMNAYTMAQYEDSSSYGNNLEVKIEEINGSTISKTFYFDTTTIYNKEPGIFYAPNQIVYKCLTYKQFDTINYEPSYKLIIRNKKTGKLITSSTKLVNAIYISNPNSDYFDLPSAGKKKIEWNSVKYGKAYQLVIRFNYFENGIAKKLDMEFPAIKSKELTGNEGMVVEFPSSFFFRTLQSNIPVIPGIVRNVGKIELIVSVAADDFSTYLDVNAPSGSIVQVRPEFSNISNGIGIFSARSNNTFKNTRKLDMGGKTNDSLKFGQYTRELGFQ